MASPHRIVDAHIHVWADDFARYHPGPGVKKEDLWLPSFTPEEFFIYCRTVGDVRINLVPVSLHGDSRATGKSSRFIH